jgi:hypothetical protein
VWEGNAFEAIVPTLFRTARRVAMTGSRAAPHAVAILLITAAAAAAQESLLAKLLRIAGLTAAPFQMRGPGDAVEPGEIWITDVAQPAPRQANRDPDYRSPVFHPSAVGTLYVLKGDTLVRLDKDGSIATTIHTVPNAIKLVGFTSDDPDGLVVLIHSDADASPLASLSLATGVLTRLPYDQKSDEERRVVAQVRGQHRVYGDTTVYTRTESKRRASRTIEWTDVFVQRGRSAPQNVSACDGVDCTQPALSPDRRRVAFVKNRR